MVVSERKENTRFGEVSVVKLTNSGGSYVELSSLGAGILAVGVPDRAGKIENVALCYGNVEDYMSDGPCMGKIPGRYANRIAGGRCVVDGVELELPVNNGPNHLHGGPDGFQNRLWKTQLLSNGVCFSLVSPDGDAGYPGELRVTATYRWSDENELSLVMEAKTDKTTIVNLTNHTYWNLDGDNAGSVLDQELFVAADRFLETDDTLVPTGCLADVSGTPMDFRKWKKLGKDIKADYPALKFGKGYDNCWVLNGAVAGELIDEAVGLRSEKSGITLTVATDQPGVQVYTANWLTGSSPENRHGRKYEDYEGVAIEAQGFPDAPNHSDFPSQLLRPGETYRRTIVFKFGK